ncbi:MAG: TetR/AcrR family transcriptional regulator [Actinobacteria bacterium]|nr:TetR/AcrR family transcriptional regulator [Actinomycetota bacterium]
MAKQPNARHSAIEQPTEPASALPSTEKGRDTRRRLMKAAAQLYENGYANARITDITDAAGLSAGAFYRYFEDRQQLTRELLREMMDEMYVFIRSPFDETQPIRSVLESTRKYFEFYEAHRALLGVVVELSQTDAEVAHLWDAAKRAFNDRIVRSLERGIAAGQMRDDLDLALAAEMLRSMTEYYAFQRFVLNGSGLSDVSLEQATNAIAEIWISGMGLDREPAATRTAPSGA